MFLTDFYPKAYQTRLLAVLYVRDWRSRLNKACLLVTYVNETFLPFRDKLHMVPNRRLSDPRNSFSCYRRFQVGPPYEWNGCPMGNPVLRCC